jgi:putative ABC transport system ATP-binding protein
MADGVGELPLEVAGAPAGPADGDEKVGATARSEARAVVEAHELYRFYHAGDDETFALRGVSLTVRQGEMVAVVGPSGSGKSTLLNCLAGLDEPDGGHVVVAGERITRRPEATRAAIRARSIGMLLQSGNLLEHLSVEGNVRAAQALARGGRAPRRPRELLAEVGLSARAAARPTTLSGGEGARAGLAVALANDPPLLLADEPTGEVDGDSEAKLIGLLLDRARSDAAVVVVTHSDRVAAAAHRVVRIADGRIVDG